MTKQYQRQARQVYEMVTLHLAGEPLNVDLTLEDFAPALGVAVAYVGNMLKLIAVQWDCTPAEVWAVIRHTEELNVSTSD